VKPHREIRQKLLGRREELAERLQRITQDVRRVKSPLDPDFAEQAVQRENDEVLDALGASIRTELGEIELTLERLEKGAYGVCARCGQPIPRKRLEALPYTSRCLDCAEPDETP
jgi:DnaK suppressor protein